MKIGIAGCTGRMGRQLITEVLASTEHQLTAGTDQKSSPHIGDDLATLAGLPAINISVSPNTECFKQCDAIIDFTSPSHTLELARLCSEHHINHIIGTTGLTDTEQAELEAYAKNTTIIHATNMSIGVNLLNSLTEKVASILDDSYDIEIIEMHHNKKVDAPSGTALTLGEYAAKGRKVSLDNVACKSRDGNTGTRPQGEIGFATLRGGDVVGDHTVIFATEGERIELTHKANSRNIFAKGALRACSWAKNQKPGLYSMQDVLG